MIGLLVSLFSGHTKVPSTPWAPYAGPPTIVLCQGPLQPYPTARVLEAVDRWRSWGAEFAGVIAKPCDHERGPLVGESWVDISAGDGMLCNDTVCMVGFTGRYLDDQGDVIATVTFLLASPDSYATGSIEHELGHALGLQHVCELPDGFSTLREGFHYCKGDEAVGHVMHPMNASTDPWIIDGVREALR